VAVIALAALVVESDHAITVDDVDHSILVRVFWWFDGIG
jgi:hypothetical protein